MFLMSSGRIASAEDSPWAQAERRFFSTLEGDHFLFCLYQILWLHTKWHHRLGEDLGGKPLDEKRERLSLRESAESLQYLMDFEFKEVGLPQGFLPITEGMISLDPVTYKFLPRKEPVLFNPKERTSVSMTELVREGRTAEQAINKILTSIRSV